MQNSVDRTTNKRIMDDLEVENVELADEIKKKMFLFEDIVKLDDKSIQRVLREVDNNSIALALKGVKVDVQEAIFRNLSSRLADMIREDMEFMGPVRIKDVEEVQQSIVDKVRELEERGEIVIARAGGDEVIV